MHLLAIARAMGEASGTEIADLGPDPDSPFPITVGPEHVVAHRGWARARDQVLSAVLAGPSLVLVLGAPGTGKTLLLQELARMLRAAGTDVLLQARGDLPIDAAKTGTADAGAGRRRVVLIDEADRMNDVALARLGQLGKCAFVLAGTPDPEDDQPGGPSTAAAVVVRLAALQPDEVGAFVAERLAQSGLSANALSAAAVARLAEHSGGMPHMLNMLADAALLLVRTGRSSRIEAAHVDQAAAHQGGDAEIGHAGIGDSGPSPPITPGIVPRQQAEPSPPVMASPALSFAAAPAPPAPAPPAPAPPAPDESRQAPRRRQIAALGVAALGVVFGVAVACGGMVAWHGGHAERASPLMATARLAPTPSGPVAPVPQPGTSPVTPPAAVVTQAKVAGPLDSENGEPVASPSPALKTVPPEPEALPPGAPAHVAIRYARGSADAAARAASLAATLRTAGFAVDALVPVLRRDTRPGARYFFAEDQDAAEAVLRAVGLPGKGSQADAAGLNALPRPGLIELTMPPGQVEAGGRLGPPNPGRS